MLKRLTPNDLSLTREPAFAFFSESKLEGELNFEHFCETWAKLIRLDMAVILVYLDEQGKTVGIAGGTVTICTMTADKIAHEAFWWVREDKRDTSPIGIRLFKEWEKAVGAMGAVRIYVGHLTSNAHKVKGIYERLGYNLLETHYVKSLRPTSR